MQSSHTQNSPPPNGGWHRAAPYVVPPAAAGLSIIPTFWGFVAKTALQQGKPIPSMTITKSLQQGCRAAPTLGFAVGLQVITQQAIEKVLLQKTPDGQKPSAGFAQMVGSSAIVGAFSSIPLAIFNAQTAGMSVIDAFRSISGRQIGAIVVRETSFLFSLRMSGPVTKAMQDRFGNNTIVECSSAFATGAIGSLVGHPFDTALTIWQANGSIDYARQLARGALTKSMTVGAFTVCYHYISKILR